MFNYIIGFLQEIYSLFIDMAPYLILGITVAGLLSIFIKRELVVKHIGKSNSSSIIKAALLGVPLPLCSCGVIPTTSYLKKYGASKPAVMSFLISTPQTGIDSLTATWGMLDPLFAISKGITALVMGIIGGFISYFFDKDDDKNEPIANLKSTAQKQESPKARFLHFINFAYKESVDDIAINFIIGLILAAFISLIIPDNFFEGTFFAHGLSSMILMVIIGIPMYICSTSSIPIAVALILKGLSPGAAYVFLVAGPATNIATIAILWRILGKKQTLLYVGNIIVGSLICGLLMDQITSLTHWTFSGAVTNAQEMFSPLDYLWAAFFAVLLIASLYRKFTHQPSCSDDCADDCGAALTKVTSISNISGFSPLSGGDTNKDDRAQNIVLHIQGMTCHHCAATVQDALESVTGTQNVRVDLNRKQAQMLTNASLDLLKTAVEKAGFKIINPS